MMSFLKDKGGGFPDVLLAFTLPPAGEENLTEKLQSLILYFRKKEVKSLKCLNYCSLCNTFFYKNDRW